MSKLPLRGLVAPIAIALAIGVGILDFRADRPAFLWLSLLFLTLGLVYARDASRLLVGTFKDD